jgi:hypothetical protein
VSPADVNGDPLFGVRLKLDRADLHLAALDAEVSAWLAQDPYGLDGEFEPRPDLGQGPDVGLYHFRFREVVPLPAEWSVVVGDVVHNARGALDHLTWQLVLANGNEPTARTQFPICLTPKTFDDEAKTRLLGVSADDRTKITSAQPFADEDVQGWTPTQIKFEQPLAILKELSNQDKHRVIIATAAIPRSVIWSPIPTSIRDLELPQGTDTWPGFGVTITDGALLMSIPAVRTGPDPHLDVGAGVGAEVNLGVHAPNRSMVATLTAILDKVRALVSEFPAES